jgi:hypothetical protein
LTALREVYDASIARWGLQQAMFANAHFRGQHDAAWTAADFTGHSDRAGRQKQTLKDRLGLMMENARLALMRPGAPPSENVPEWARGEYQGRNAS